MTLLEYAKSDLAKENAAVRALNGDAEGLITARHVEAAKEVVRRKVLVGLADNGCLAASLEQFERYLGRWDDVAASQDARRCQEEQLDPGSEEKDDASSASGTLDWESEEYAELARRNWANVQLYHYAKILYEEQAALVV